MTEKQQTRDYFAEMYVAGMMADRGWNVYFPRRDMGFDFIITKQVGEKTILRPVQVKGKFPGIGKLNKVAYGYIGKLSQLHDDMVLAIPFFSQASKMTPPDYVAFMPRRRIRIQTSRGYACCPASFKNGTVLPRRDYSRYFGYDGIALMESGNWA